MTLAAEPASGEFTDLVQPFLEAHCTKCHGEEKQKGKVALHDLDLASLGGADAELWSKVVEVLKFREMPPEEEAQPDADAIEEVTDWVQRRLAAAGRESDIEHKLKQPAYANALSHEKLFDGSVSGAAFSPPRLWRLHPEAYSLFLDEFGRELGQGGPLSRPFTTSEGKGTFGNYAALMQADSAALGQLMLNCRQIATLQTEGFSKLEQDRRTKEMVERVFRRAPASFEALMEAEGPLTSGHLEAAVKEEFQIVLRRDPEADELARYGDLLERAIAIGGRSAGLRTMAMAVLLRPDAIYRLEVGLNEPDEHGRRLLSPHELAHAIAYALTDTPPDRLLLGAPRENDRSKRPQPPSLLDLAEEGKLSTREDVREVVLRIWEHEGIEKPRILRFFHEFFGYHLAPTVFKGERAGKEFNTSHLVRDADHLVMHLVERDRDVLRELLTTDQFFVEWAKTPEEYERRIKYVTDRINPDRPDDRNYQYFIERTKKGLRPMPQANPTWRITVRFYNLDEETWDYPLQQPFAMPEGQRCGILTHPAWLVAWSGNFGNDPIHRGKWIRDHLLAGTVPDVPITVDARVPEDPHKTLRDRLEVTREAYCWKCHQRMDPLGLPFEAYTDFGRFRTEEGLGSTRALKDARESAPVVTTGQIIASGDETLDGEVEDVHELMHRLASSDRVRQSFVRHAFRYWMGRNELLSDSPVLISADRAYLDGNGSFKALVVSLLTSDAFLYRK